MASETLMVKLKGVDEFSGSFNKLNSSAGGMGRALKSGAVVAAAGVAVLAGGIALCVKEFMGAEAVQTQTVAAIKSTGGAANVTAAHVGEYASRLAELTGIGDEEIQMGQNMLLTFTNIRNEVGAGNDIFDQATETVLDMSVALGQDTTQSAMQLGKALNDPIAGVTALQRVGVKLTDAQKDQVKAMVESGNVMGAQKIILGELQKEFGGSAEAAGQTFGGQLGVLKTKLGDVAEGIGEGAIPALKDMMSAVGDNIGVFESLGGMATTIMGPLSDLFSEVMTFLSESGIIEDFGALFGDAFQIAVDVVGDLFEALTPLIPPIMDIAQTVMDMVGIVAPLIGKLVGLFGEALQPILEAVGGALETLETPLESVVGIFSNMIEALAPIAGFLGEILGGIIELTADGLAIVLKPLEWLASAFGGAADESTRAADALDRYKESTADSSAKAQILLDELGNTQAAMAGVADDQEALNALKAQEREQIDGLISVYPQLYAGMDMYGDKTIIATDQAQNMLNAGKGILAVQNEEAAGWTNTTNTLGSYIDQVTNGDAALIAFNETTQDWIASSDGASQANSRAAITQKLMAEGLPQTTEEFNKLTEGLGFTEDELALLGGKITDLNSQYPGLADGTADVTAEVAAAQSEFQRLSKEIIKTASVAGSEGAAIPTSIISALKSGVPEIIEQGALAMDGYVNEMVEGGHLSQAEASNLVSSMETTLGQFQAGEISGTKMVDILNKLKDANPKIGAAFDTLIADTEATMQGATWAEDARTEMTTLTGNITNSKDSMTGAMNTNLVVTADTILNSGWPVATQTQMDGMNTNITGNTGPAQTAMGGVMGNVDATVKGWNFWTNPVKAADADNLSSVWQRGKTAMWNMPAWLVKVRGEAHVGGQIFHGGGAVQSFAGGGMPRGSGVNEVPAILERKEYVIRKEAVKKVGVPFLDAINSGKRVTTRRPTGGGGGGAGAVNVTLSAGAFMGSPGEARRFASQIQKYLTSEEGR